MSEIKKYWVIININNKKYTIEKKEKKYFQLNKYFKYQIKLFQKIKILKKITNNLILKNNNKMSLNIKKKKGQKHQNKQGFKPMFNDRLINLQKTAPLDHLCLRCMDQIKWKLQYCKYKVIKDPHTCQKCKFKTVIKSYRHCCDKCANEFKICAKCMQQKEIAPYQGPEKKGVENALLKEMQDYLKLMRERSRRKVLRLINEGKITFNKEESCFEDIETGEPLKDLQFKNGMTGLNGDDDDDDLEFYGNEDLEDEEDEEDEEEGDKDLEEEEKIKNKQQKKQLQDEQDEKDLIKLAEGIQIKGSVQIQKQQQQQQQQKQENTEQQQQKEEEEEQKKE